MRKLIVIDVLDGTDLDEVLDFIEDTLEVSKISASCRIEVKSEPAQECPACGTRCADINNCPNCSRGEPV